MSSRSTASDVMLPATTDTTERVLRRAIALLAGSGCDPNQGRSHDPTVPSCSFAVVAGGREVECFVANRKSTPSREVTE